MGKFPEELKRLVDQFTHQFDTVIRPDYNETLIRVDYINPMMRALGWDIENSKGYAEQYREVVHEDRVKVGGQSKAPDYSFRIGGTRKFFLEAKKPAVKIRDNPEPAFQIRRYGWSAKLAVSLLTDFQEFAIYDTRKRPKQGDKAREARREYLTYDQYEAKWDFIHGTFSKDAVLRGDFDRYCESTKARGAEPVDEAFLDEIEGWRELLAKNIALRNEDLDEPGLNFTVQRIIDRIIFLRIAEDRGTEKENDLKLLLKGDGVYDRLKERFRLADARYNSGLFHFKTEGGRGETPDTLTPTIAIDDKPLREIVSDLYLPKSPYEFSYLSADILGSVYERFLGKVITRKGKTSVDVKDKPEVRKAGGVYYTPVYIVDYIVKNTVGTLLEGKTPPRAEAIKVLDPACGSGSFLIGAYQFLLDWYLKQYAPSDEVARTHAKGKKPKLREAVVKPPAPEDKDRFVPGWALTIDERKRILLAHIHGVDLDAQAVEVTKLNLLLKCLEGETAATLGFDSALFRDRALPDLGHNVLCGNSLVGTDIIGTDAWNAMSEEGRGKVNPFDYMRAFPQAAKQRGFDAVIGNPPYVRIQTLQEHSPMQAVEIKRKYASASTGNFDLYVVFIERGFDLLNAAGRFGMILPSKFATADYGQPIRERIVTEKSLNTFVDFGSEQVFKGATTYTCLLFLDHVQRDDFQYERVIELKLWGKSGSPNSGRMQIEQLTAHPWKFRVGGSGSLAVRLDHCEPKLGDLADVFVGVQTSADAVFILKVRGLKNGVWECVSQTGAMIELEASGLRAIVSGTDVKRYRKLQTRQCVIFPYEVVDETATLRSFTEIEQITPLVAEYLKANRDQLKQRERGKFADSSWYRFGRNQNIGIQGRTKLCVPRLVERLNATYDRSGAFCLDNVDVGGVTFKAESPLQDLLYLVALINSKLLGWYFPNVSTPFRGNWYSANRQFLDRLPIVIPTDLMMVSTVAALADSMLSLHARLASEHLPQRREQIQREIEATDRQIDQLVYQLYGLTNDEIRIVEEATG